MTIPTNITDGDERRVWAGNLRWVKILTIFAGWSLMVGCVGPEMMGDRAMERGDPAEALHQYDQAIAEGSRDPDLYYRAAQAAQQQGAFARAERYFSQSLRYGGGVEIARALAEFYIQTSNYMQAVRVFQYLLRIEEDDQAVQPLYSNLGAALMYGGKYVDAESYLLLAQQERPQDPIPYINLGVLYDRHLRNMPKAVRFYECFTELSNDSSQVRTVQTRLREIENRRATDTSRVGLECGSEYRVSPAEQHDLGEIFDLDEGADIDDRAGFDEPIVIDRLNLDLPLDYDPSESRGEMPPLGASDGDRDEVDEDRPIEIIDDTAAPGSDDAQAIDGLGEAHQSGRYDEVVDILEQAGEHRQLDRAQRGLLGEAYFETGRFEEAAAVLENLVSEEPTPIRARRLIESYHRLDDGESKQAVCDRFAGWPAYEEVLDRCQ